MTFTLADVVHIVSLLIATGAILYRMSQRDTRVDMRLDELTKAIAKASPHVDNMPLLIANVMRHEDEIKGLRTRNHRLANHVQWLLSVVPQERPPSVPDVEES